MSSTTKETCPELSQDIADIICEHVAEPYLNKGIKDGSYFWPHLKYSHARWKRDIANFRLLNRKFAKAGFRLMLRWISASFDTFYYYLEDVMGADAGNLAETVKSVRICDRKAMALEPNFLEFVEVVSFHKLSDLEIEHSVEPDDYRGLPGCFSIHILAKITLPNLTRLSLSMSSGAAFSDMLAGLTRDRKSDGSKAISDVFSRLRYLSLKGPPGWDRMPREAHRYKTMLFIAAMACNVKDLRLKSFELDDNLWHHALAEKRKIATFPPLRLRSGPLRSSNTSGKRCSNPREPRSELSALRGGGIGYRAFIVAVPKACSMVSPAERSA